ncbi:MAG: exosortase H-associated membrane protein [Pseudomarimonas sp.]
MTLSPLRHFVLSAMLFLPLAFFLWFVLAGPVVWPVAQLANLIVPQLLPDAVSSVVLHGSLLEVETKLLTEAGPNGQRGILVLDVRPLIYAWCLPLFVGLVLATPLEGRRRWRQIAIGLPVLWLIVTWGAVFDILKLLTFDAGPLGEAAMAAAGFSADFVGLGYQFGYLILPAVTPVSLWVLLNSKFLEELVGWSGEPAAPNGGPTTPVDSLVDSTAPVVAEPAVTEPDDSK